MIINALLCREGFLLFDLRVHQTHELYSKNSIMGQNFCKVPLYCLHRPNQRWLPPSRTGIPFMHRLNALSHQSVDVARCWIWQRHYLNGLQQTWHDCVIEVIRRVNTESEVLNTHVHALWRLGWIFFFQLNTDWDFFAPAWSGLFMQLSHSMPLPFKKLPNWNRISWMLWLQLSPLLASLCFCQELHTTEYWNTDKLGQGGTLLAFLLPL